MGLKSFVTNIDAIGIEPSFTFSRQSRFKTFFGGVLTVLLILLFIAGFFYFGRDLYEKINPVLLNSKSINMNPKSLELTPANFPFYIALENNLDNLNYFKDPTVFTIQGKFRNQVRYIDASGVVRLNVTSTNIKLVDCDLNYHFPGMIKDFNSTAYQIAYCIAPNQTIQIEGDFPNDVFNIMQFNLFQCFNTTAVQNCKSQNVIEAMIRTTYVSINYGTYIPKPANFTSPMERTKVDYFTTVSIYNQKQINLYLKRIFHTTDQGIIFEDPKEVVYNDVDYIREFLTTDPPVQGGRFLQIGVRMSYTEEFTTRSYMKVQQVLANVGGLFKFFSLTFELTILFLTKEYFYLHLINENFRINDKNGGKPNSSGRRANPQIPRMIQLNNVSNNTTTNRNISDTYKSHIKFNSRNDLPTIRNSDNQLKKNEAVVHQSLDRLNERFQKCRAGVKLDIPTWSYIKIFYCKSKKKDNARYYQLYKRGKFAIKNCIDINHVIYKLIEFEKLKQIILDKHELYLFDLRPNFNIESIGDGTSGGMSRMFTKKEDSMKYNQLHEAYSHVKATRSKKNQRLLEFYDKSILELLNT
jgi:hypothetical protein